MSSYHINPESGDAGKCEATVGKCPFGSAEQHFTSLDAARLAFETDHRPFMLKKREGFGSELADWREKLPPTVEEKIALRWNRQKQFLISAARGEVDTTYAVLENFLQPPIFAERPRGTYFEPISEEPDELEYQLVLHTRQGGDNRECVCDSNDPQHEAGCLALNIELMENHPQYLSDADDDDDRTYANFVFRGGWTEKELKLHQEHLASQSEISETDQLHRDILNGKLPPWAVLRTDASEELIYQQSQLAVQQAQNELTRIQKVAALATQGLKAISEDTKLPTEQLSAIAKAVGIPSYEQRNFGIAIDTYWNDKRKLQRQQAMHKQAEELPEGELREYLLGDRGTGSYNTTEKVGRRTVTVRKDYARGNLLGEELKTAKADFERSSKSLAKYLEPLKAKEAEAQEKTKFLEEVQKIALTERKKAWAAGWPGNAKSLPPIPETF